MIRITFLGGGGGRVINALQILPTAGFFVEFFNTNFYVDPGPCVLCKLKEMKIKPFIIKNVVVTHFHCDHSAGLYSLLDAVTLGGIKKRGNLFAPESLLKEKVVPDYLINSLNKVVVMKEKSFDVDDIKVTFTKAIHGIETYGIIFEGDNKRVGYSSDTAFREEIALQYKDVDLLILNVLRPGNSKLENHMCVNEAIEFIKIANPKKVVVQHFGYKFYNYGIYNEVERIKKETKVDVEIGLNKVITL